MLGAVGSTRRTATMPAAEPLADPLGDQDLVGGSPSGRALVPGHHLGAIALADALDQALPVGKLLGRGRWRLARHGCRLAHATSLATIQSSPRPARHNCTGSVGRRSQPPRKHISYLSV